MECKAHILRDIPEAFASGRWQGLTVRQMRHIPELASGLGAFTTVRSHPDGYIYCGTTALDNDILYRFDRATASFCSLNYRSVAEPFEVKVHRSLEIDTDGRIFGATAALHDLDERDQAPGGAIFVFTPKTKTIEKLALPVPHDYIQNITLDRRRRKLHGATYPAAHFFSYDLNSGETVARRYIGSYPHLLAIDANGRVWGTWGDSNFLFAYDPDSNAFHFTRVALPGLERTDRGALDAAVNGGDEYVYLGTTQGALVRLDPSNPDEPKLEFLGKPLPKWRMPGLVCPDDREIYIVAGGEYDVHLLKYDRPGCRFTDLGRILDKETGLACYMPHDLSLTPDGFAYVGETDHPERSGYLWECRL